VRNVSGRGRWSKLAEWLSADVSKRLRECMMSGVTVPPLAVAVYFASGTVGNKSIASFQACTRHVRLRRQHFISTVRDGVCGDQSRISSRVSLRQRRRSCWDRWQRGESLKAIGRAFSKPSHLFISNWLRTVGFVLRHGVARDWHDALGARGDLQRIAAAQSARSMARLLGRSPSTVSRELNRMAAMIATEQRWRMR